MDGSPSISDIIDRNKPTVVVIHSPRVAAAPPGASEAGRPKTARVLPKGCDSRDPRNFLLTGGARALDKDREKQQAAAAREKVKELKTASTALASELLRTRHESEREITALRDDMLELTSRFKAEQERIALLKARLAEEGKARGELEEAHQERLCELHRRLQAEHLLRVNAESELAKSQGVAGAAAAQLKGFETELAGALQEASTLQDAKLEAELVLNKERRQHAETQGQLESSRLLHEKERARSEALQRKNAELEGTVQGLSERNSSLFEELKAAEAALLAAKEAKVQADKAVAHNKEEIRVLTEQLEAQRKARGAAADEARRLQQRVAQLEASTAVYIAKEAHYDDLKEEFEESCQALQRTQADLERAKGDVRSLMERLDAAGAKASSLEGTLRARDEEARRLRDELERARQEVAKGDVALAEAQAAAQLAVAAARDKDGAITRLEAALAEAQGAADAARRGREELGRAMQEKDGYTEALKADLRALQDELALLHRRNKQLQTEAEAGELEVSRRELKLKEMADKLQALATRGAEEQAAAAAEKRRMEGVIRLLETRSGQAQSELSAAKQELAALQAAKVTAAAELGAAQDECTHLRAQLTEEQARGSKLRGELAAVSSSHMREVESKGQEVAGALARMQAEEAARVAAEQEARTLKRRVEDLETSLAEAQGAQTRTQEGLEHSQAALEATKRKLQVYKKENKNLMSSYDDWLKNMVRSRPNNGGSSGEASPQ